MDSPLSLLGFSDKDVFRKVCACLLDARLFAVFAREWIGFMAALPFLLCFFSYKELLWSSLKVEAAFLVACSQT